MKHYWRIGVALLVWVTSSLVWAQAGPVSVTVEDPGPNTNIAGPGAPTHIVGLPRTIHDITLNTGKVGYALRYLISRDPEEPGVGVVGEGYIGMTKPTGANWYAGGFFDLKLNGASIGTTVAETFCGRATGDRGYVDYVFDAPQAVTRLRFVGLPGADCLYAQLLLEPKEELTEVEVSLRCYPSAFVTSSKGAERHVLTPTRDLVLGERPSLDPEAEYWINCYDAVYDAGVVTPYAKGAGSCSALWVPEHVAEASVNVGDYHVAANLRLDPSLRDFRFVFFDHAGVKNAEAQAELMSRGAELVEQVRGFDFTDRSVRDWAMDEKLEETRQLLAGLPEDEERTARYDQWHRDLQTHLEAMQGDTAIRAEGQALNIIAAWEQSLPDLRLEALLATF